jgi:hypothetical protein
MKDFSGQSSILGRSRTLYVQKNTGQVARAGLVMDAQFKPLAAFRLAVEISMIPAQVLEAEVYQFLQSLPQSDLRQTMPCLESSKVTPNGFIRQRAI